MDAALLARIQFAFTVGFHFLFPPLSIGLGVALAIMKGMYLKTKNPVYSAMADFWLKVFALTFSVGVATGIVMEFEFGTNWATYSRFVGDIFGSPLAAEGVFAFFLESTFLGVLLFGKNRVSAKTHFISSVLVAFGAMMSAFWIIVANSWMQTPTGYHVVQTASGLRAEITDFWAMVFNPSTMERYTHVLGASWMTGAFLIISISAWYLLKKKHLDFAKGSMKIGLFLAAFAAFFQLVTGHSSAVEVAKYQPAKLAAFEGHYDSLAVGDLYLFGYVDVKNEKTYGVAIPGMLSLLTNFDPSSKLVGLKAFKPEERPNVQMVFQTYHIMISLGMAFIGMTVLGLFYMWKGKLWDTKWLLWAFVPSFILPQIACQTGWIAAEVGRQPWIVQGLLLTKDAISKSVDAGQIIFSLVLFGGIYSALLGLFIFLLLKKIKAGPAALNS